MYPTGPNVWVGNSASHQGVREETEKCTKGMERRILGITWRDRKRASWIREQTKVKDILIAIKNKKWTWAGHVMRRHYNRWTTRVTEWQPRNGRKQGRQSVRWRDEIRAFTEPSWSSLTSERERWRMLGKAFVLQWTSNGWIWWWWWLEMHLGGIIVSVSSHEFTCLGSMPAMVLSPPLTQLFILPLGLAEKWAS